MYLKYIFNEGITVELSKQSKIWDVRKKELVETSYQCRYLWFLSEFNIIIKRSSDTEIVPNIPVKKLFNYRN